MFLTISLIGILATLYILYYKLHHGLFHHADRVYANMIKNATAGQRHILKKLYTDKHVTLEQTEWSLDGYVLVQNNCCKLTAYSDGGPYTLIIKESFQQFLNNHKKWRKHLGIQ